MDVEQCDLLIVGGGIHGVGVAQAGAAAGHRSVLLEQDSLAAGTSSRSSKLIHGGLRYLESGHLGLVRESLREREWKEHERDGFENGEDSPEAMLIKLVQGHPGQQQRAEIGDPLEVAIGEVPTGLDTDRQLQRCTHGDGVPQIAALPTPK